MFITRFFVLEVIHTMSRSLIWFRRSLRLDDLQAFRLPVERGDEIACIVIRDSSFRIGPGTFADRTKMYDDAVASLAGDLAKIGGKLYLLDGNPEEEVPIFLSQNNFTDLWFAEEIEPSGISRDRMVRTNVEALGICVHATNDQYLYPPTAFVTGTGKPYSVFTPFKKRCLSQIPGQPVDAPKTVKWININKPSVFPVIPSGGDTFCAVGTASAYRHFSEFCASDIDDYAEKRDIPADRGTSRLSPHLHFGVVSPRRLLHIALGAGSNGALTYASELIWRDFYAQVLYHRPDTVTSSFQPQWDQLVWEDNADLIDAWMNGRTGYPIVDAAMRQLNTTGWMHNRLRMIVASFLTKDLLVDWRIGETYFRSRLLDGDLASNVGGWQWAASTGTDAQPWFRVFNPITQGDKFDPDGRFVRAWLPELKNVPDKFIHAPWQMTYSESRWVGLRFDLDYPSPIVDHGVQRARALEMFKKVTSTRETL